MRENIKDANEGNAGQSPKLPSRAPSRCWIVVRLVFVHRKTLSADVAAQPKPTSSSRVPRALRATPLGIFKSPLRIVEIGDIARNGERHYGYVSRDMGLGAAARGEGDSGR